MTKTAILDRSTAAASAQRAPARAKDDAAMLKAAANLTRDLNAPRSSIYWADILGSALLGQRQAHLAGGGHVGRVGDHGVFGPAAFMLGDRCSLVEHQDSRR